MKSCTKCKVIRPFSCYAKDRAAKDGLSFRCKECQKQRRVEDQLYIKEYSIKTKDSRKKYMAEYCRDTREEREQFLKACHYTNLQPLWAEDNLSKSNKVLGVE